MRPTVAYVDLDKLVHNYNAIKRHVGDKTRIMAMVKADAYGHGLLPVSKTLEQAGADYLGVAMIEEGVRLRRANVKLPILCVGASFKSSLEEGIKEDIILTLYETGQLCDMQEAAERVGKKARVHIKLETGMNRLGAHTDGELLQLARELKKCDMVQAEGVFTHFAASDSADKTFTYEQASIFNRGREILANEGFDRLIAHAACSGGTLDCPDLYYDMVRPGIALYGYPPSSEVINHLPLEPIMRIESRLSQVKHIKAGESVGYGRSYTAQKDMCIGVVPIGYGDGYRRALSNKGFVIINGCRANILGRVCMDQMMVDITDIPAESGDLAVLLGKSGGEKFDAEDMAEICGTISYEITLGFTARVPKIYYGEAYDRLDKRGL